jgi:DNA-binding response OmpR family regulator
MGKDKKIFIADDDPDILEILSLMLRINKYNVQASTNANDIFKNQEDLPDLILLDIWMSGLDGREICKRLKENKLTQKIPVIFVSANSNIEEITHQYKAQGFIAKPFEMKKLLKEIDVVLQKSVN